MEFKAPLNQYGRIFVDYVNHLKHSQGKSKKA